MALMITRRSGQRVVLETSDGDIEVFVGRVQANGNVSLGFSAPVAINIRREELPTRKGESDETQGPEKRQTARPHGGRSG